MQERESLQDQDSLTVHQLEAMYQLGRQHLSPLSGLQCDPMNPWYFFLERSCKSLVIVHDGCNLFTWEWVQKSADSLAFSQAMLDVASVPQPEIPTISCTVLFI